MKRRTMKANIAISNLVINDGTKYIDLILGKMYLDGNSYPSWRSLTYDNRDYFVILSEVYDEEIIPKEDVIILTYEEKQ